MEFTDRLFSEIEQKQWDIDGFLEKLKEKKVVIWGTGLAGNMILDALTRLQIPISFFADNNRQKRGMSIHGKTVLGIDQIPGEAFIIIAANVKYGIHEQLCGASITDYKYIDPIWLYSYKENDVFSSLKSNKDSIDEVYNMLTDEDSKKVYRNILLHRAVHDIHLVWEVYDEHQYFGNPIVRNADGNFVDCGAFQGDTLSCFLEQIREGTDYKYYAFEADPQNYEVLRSFCEERNLYNVKPINLGVWDRHTHLSFKENQATGEVSGKIIEENDASSETIEVNSLDAVLDNAKVDFIKMDIEGAEIKALQGARNCIQTNLPTLAISAYHELEHLWKVPLLIKTIDKDYDIYFGHHMWNMADTVCYGLYKSERI